MSKNKKTTKQQPEQQNRTREEWSCFLTTHHHHSITVLYRFFPKLLFVAGIPCSVHAWNFWPPFSHFFDDERGLALRTRLRKRLVPGWHRCSSGSCCSSERTPCRVLIFYQRDPTVSRALHAGGNRFSILALRIPGTGHELAETAAFDDHRAAALVAPFHRSFPVRFAAAAFAFRCGRVLLHFGYRSMP
jgi:hypothetical protein